MGYGADMSTSNRTRLTYTVPEASALLGISRGAGYEAARTGNLAGVPVIRIGHRLVVPKAALDSLHGIESAADETRYES